MRPPQRAREDASLISLSCVLPLTQTGPASATIRCAEQRPDQTTFRACTAPAKTNGLCPRAYSLPTPSGRRSQFSCFVVRRKAGEELLSPETRGPDFDGQG